MFSSATGCEQGCWRQLPAHDDAFGGKGMPSMIRQSSAALGALFLLACQGVAVAQSEVDPYLPRCKSLRETRIPIPTWDNNHGKLASLRRLISTWPSGVALVIYGSFGAEDDNVRIEGQDLAYSVKMTFEGNGPEAGEVKVSASKSPQFTMGYWTYWGFFEVAPPGAPNREIALRQLDTFDVVSSARYCRGNGPPPSLRKTPAAQNTQSGSLPGCRRLYESRIPIATWRPELTRRHSGMFEVHVAPPSGNGRIVYISIEDPTATCDTSCHPNQPCDTSPSADLYSVLLPDSPAEDSGGVSINLRGNRTPAGKGCRFEGFYMNEPVAGIHQGWTESYFGAIDRKRIVASNHYCMAPQR
jgi:hypothetical protein